MLDSPHAKLAIPKGAEDVILGFAEHSFRRLEELGREEIELASRGRRYVEEYKDAAPIVRTMITGYRCFRRNYRELGLYRPEYIGVNLEDIFASEAPELGTITSQRLVDRLAV